MFFLLMFDLIFKKDVMIGKKSYNMFWILWIVLHAHIWIYILNQTYFLL